jgi:hypothetical protein
VQFVANRQWRNVARGKVIWSICIVASCFGFLLCCY